MKCAIVTNCFLDGIDAHGDSHMARMKRFIEYYNQPALKEILGHSKIILLDNGSENNWPENETTQVIKFTRLPHGSHSTTYDYPGSWRALYQLAPLLETYDKIIWLDTDSFILTPRLAHFIRWIDKGWVGFKCKKYNFPESGCFILCKEWGREVLKRWTTKAPYTSHFGKMIETGIPFTSMRVDFDCDRYGDFRPTKEQTPLMDLYNNATLATPLKFDMLTDNKKG